MRNYFAVTAVTLSLFTLSCGVRKASEPFSKTVEDFVYSSLALSPVTATAVGYHQHMGVNLDEKLDDYSLSAIDEQRTFYTGFREQLNEIGRDTLPPEDRADYDIIDQQISLALLELNTIKSYERNPTIYVELLGNALFSPHVLQYAPKQQRYQHIIKRLEKTPRFLEQARQNLKSAPELWTTVAQQENEGNAALIDQTLREGVPEELKAEYDRSAKPALAAIREFNGFLKNSLSKRQSDWRMGGGNYAQKFRHTLAIDQTPQQILADAEAELKAVRKQMFEIAIPLHKKMYPHHRDPVDLNLIVGEVLQKIGQRHATPKTYVSDARRDLEEATQFVREKNLLALPTRDNLEVIETPEFMRGIYAVGGFNPAPALEPQLGAFYWLTPIPETWPAARIESKLREYNYYGLKLLTIHEAMPGHYVQFEYANEIEPKPRRLLRGIFGNGPYIEGWAVYSTQAMLDEGYLNKSPELRLTFLKQQLRMLANTVLDIRLQTMGMTDEQAMDLMVKDAFQEEEEARAKLQRAKLSQVQLTTYFTGWREWMRLREDYQKAKGSEFRLHEFHEKALKQGAVPMPVLKRLMIGTK